jgi:hypothetical protein
MKRFSAMGAFVGSGTIENILAPDNIGDLLKWTCGNVQSSVANDTVYIHNFTYTQELDSFTVEEWRGITGLNALFLTGCAVKSLTLEAPARETCQYTVEYQYADEELDTATSMGTLNALRPFTFAGGSVSLGGSALGAVEAMRFVWENDIPDDHHETGSNFLQRMQLDDLSITGEIDLKFLNWDVRQELYGGTGTPTEPQSEDDTEAIILDFLAGPTGDGVIPNYNLKITLPVCTLTENPAEVVGRDRLTQRFSFEALWDAGIKIELWNKVVSY